MKKIFGNPFGQVLLILAEIAGLVSSIYLGVQCLLLAGDKFAGLFGADTAYAAVMAMGTIWLPALLLLIALILTIAGLAGRKRGVGLTSVILVLVALLAQGVCFVLGFSDLTKYFASLDFGKMLEWGLNLVIFGYMSSTLGVIFALIAIICAGAKKKPGAIVLAIFALVFIVFGCFAFLYPIFRETVGDPYILLAFFAGQGIASVELLPYILFIVRGIFIALVGVSVFVLVFERYPARAVATASEEKAVVAEEPKKVESAKSDEPKNDKGETFDIYKSKDRIIIEIR